MDSFAENFIQRYSLGYSIAHFLRNIQIDAIIISYMNNQLEIILVDCFVSTFKLSVRPAKS